MSAIPFKAMHPMLSGLRQAEVRGVWLSHLIGFAFFFSLVFNRIIMFELPFTKATEIPIRLIAIWLLVDRIGRRGKVKVSMWDYLHLGFAGLYALMLVYADAYMVRQTGIQGYVTWAIQFLNPYFFFLIAREGTLRRGFKPHIVINWMLGTIAFTCFFALAQGMNILGLREKIDLLVHQRQAEMKLEGPSQPWQARGLFVHANSMAIILIQALSLLFGAISYRRAGPFEVFCFATFVVTLFATFSRTGIASVVVLAVAVVVLFLVQKKLKEALLLSGLLATLAMAFITIVWTFDVQRYKVFLTGPGIIKNEANRGLQGWYLRQGTIQRALAIVDDYPFTGIQPASTALNAQRVIHKSAYSFEGLLLNVYIYSWVAFGLPGVIYLAGMFYMSIGHLRFVRTRLAFAPAAFLVGISIAITGISENTAFDQYHMIITNVIMAFAVQKLVKKVDAEEVAAEDNPFVPKWMKWLGLKGLGTRWIPQ